MRPTRNLDVLRNYIYTAIDKFCQFGKESADVFSVAFGVAGQGCEMTKLNGTFIRDHALVEGGSKSWVDFLRTEVVAKKVADAVWNYLKTHGQSKGRREHLVRTRQSHSYPGTWRVEVLLPGVTLHGRQYDAYNEARRRVGVAALKSAYNSGDLVGSWRSPQ